MVRYQCEISKTHTNKHKDIFIVLGYFPYIQNSFIQFAPKLQSNKWTDSFLLLCINGVNYTLKKTNLGQKYLALYPASSIETNHRETAENSLAGL